MQRPVFFFVLFVLWLSFFYACVCLRRQENATDCTLSLEVLRTVQNTNWPFACACKCRNYFWWLAPIVIAASDGCRVHAGTNFKRIVISVQWPMPKRPVIARSIIGTRKCAKLRKQRTERATFAHGLAKWSAMCLQTTRARPAISVLYKHD